MKKETSNNYPSFEIKDSRKTDTDILTKPIEEIKEPIKIQVVEAVYGDPIPLFNHILVAREVAETTWNGSTLYIPETAQKSPNCGVVVEVGPFYIYQGNVRPISEIVNPGDIVTFSQYNVEDVQKGENTYCICSVFDLKLVEKKYGTSANQLSSLVAEIERDKSK